MAKNTPSLLFLSLSLLASLLQSIIATCTLPVSPDSSHNVKGMFIFGSSYVDNGNNNFLKNDLLKVNYAPYGIDFVLGPSGRFTNGKNVIDLLGEKLGLSYIPVFSSPDTKGNKIIHGVSFSSGGSGILDDTGSAGGVTSLSQQIQNFKAITLAELEKQLGCRSRESLPSYLFVIGVGGNDYTLNYFPRKLKGDNVTLRAFTSTLTTLLTSHIQKLYELGARKFMLMSAYPIGCSPIIKASAPRAANMGCIRIVNNAARRFNSRLKLMVDTSTQHMPGSNLIYVNAYDVIHNIIKHPRCQGFKNTTTACCEMTKPSGLCKREGSVCADRKSHVYFDGLHPTEDVNKLIAKSVYSSNLTTQVYPFNAKHLASIP